MVISVTLTPTHHQHSTPCYQDKKANGVVRKVVNVIRKSKRCAISYPDRNCPPGRSLDKKDALLRGLTLLFELIFEEISSKNKHYTHCSHCWHDIMLLLLCICTIWQLKVWKLVWQRRFATSGTGEKFNSTEGILLAPPKDDLIFWAPKRLLLPL